MRHVWLDFRSFRVSYPAQSHVPWPWAMSGNVIAPTYSCLQGPEGKEKHYLNSIVEQWSRALETTVFLLLLGEPVTGILDVRVLHKDVCPGLREGLEHKGSQPVQQRGGRDVRTIPHSKITTCNGSQVTSQVHGGDFWGNDTGTLNRLFFVQQTSESILKSLNFFWFLQSWYSPLPTLFFFFLLKCLVEPLSLPTTPTAVCWMTLLPHSLSVLSLLTSLNVPYRSFFSIISLEEGFCLLFLFGRNPYFTVIYCTFRTGELGYCELCCYEYRVHVSFGITVFSGYMSRSGTAGSYGSSVFSFLRKLNCILFSIVVVPIYVPTKSAGGFRFLHTLSSICNL